MIFYEPDLALYIAFTWSELGNVELAAGNLAQAGDYYQRFLAFCHARNDRYHTAHAYWDLGNVLQLRGQNDDWERAEANYLEALLLFRDVAEAYYEFNVLASLGSLSALRGDLAGATTRYSHALEIIETLPRRGLVRGCTGGLRGYGRQYIRPGCPHPPGCRRCRGGL